MIGAHGDGLQYAIAVPFGLVVQQYQHKDVIGYWP